jgi:cyclopropane fatty-acyl-phospholipid synthase-like methyltransferase
MAKATFIALGVFAAVSILVLALAGGAHAYMRRFSNYAFVQESKLLRNGGRPYMNVGWWGDGATSLGDAQEDMYARFFAAAHLDQRDQRVLETGCGSCAHYDAWTTQGSRAHITCYEKRAVTSSAAWGANGGKIEVEQRLAGELDAVRRFDVILSVESAFHYGDRAGFFAKCRRALKPAGRLLLTDIVVRPDVMAKASLPKRLATWYYVRHILGMPAENAVSMNQYRADLKAAGFAHVRVDDVSAQTLTPFYARFDDNVDTRAFPEPLRSLNKWFSGVLGDPNESPLAYVSVECIA